MSPWYPTEPRRNASTESRGCIKSRRASTGDTSRLFDFGLGLALGSGLCLVPPTHCPNFTHISHSRALELFRSMLGRQCGPGFLANSSRNFIMSSTSFVVTPIVYKKYFPMERRYLEARLTPGSSTDRTVFNECMRLACDVTTAGTKRRCSGLALG